MLVFIKKGIYEYVYGNFNIPFKSNVYHLQLTKND